MDCSYTSTLLELVQALLDVTYSDEELVALAEYMIQTGSVTLVGIFGSPQVRGMSFRMP